MAKFTVTLRRVTMFQLTIEAPTARDVRAQINADGPHEWMLDNATAECSDTTTIASVKRTT